MMKIKIRKLKYQLRYADQKIDQENKDKYILSVYFYEKIDHNKNQQHILNEYFVEHIEQLENENAQLINKVDDQEI